MADCGCRVVLIEYGARIQHCERHSEKNVTRLENENAHLRNALQAIADTKGDNLGPAEWAAEVADLTLKHHPGCAIFLDRFCDCQDELFKEMH